MGPPLCLLDHSCLESEAKIFVQRGPQIRFALRLLQEMNTPISEPSSAPVAISTAQRWLSCA